jgi:hypothetical protein
LDSIGCQSALKMKCQSTLRHDGEGPLAVERARTVETTKNDRWDLLDLHDVGQRKARSLRIGVTYLPGRLDEPRSRIVTEVLS